MTFEKKLVMVSSIFDLRIPFTTTVVNKEAIFFPTKKMSKEAINMLLLLGAVLVYFFLIFRAPMKRRKELKKFVESLSAGDKVITSSGIHGKVLEVAETTILISSEGSKLRVDKNSIARSSEDLVK